MGMPAPIPPHHVHGSFLDQMQKLSNAATVSVKEFTEVFSLMGKGVANAHRTIFLTNKNTNMENQMDRADRLLEQEQVDREAVGLQRLCGQEEVDAWDNYIQ